MKIENLLALLLLMYIIMQISKKIKAKASITITTINAIISDEDSSLKILSNLRFDIFTSTDAVVLLSYCDGNHKRWDTCGAESCFSVIGIYTIDTWYMNIWRGWVNLKMYITGVLLSKGTMTNSWYEYRKLMYVYFRLNFSYVVVKSSFPRFNEATICIYMTDET